jgi:lipoprotein-releasing system permease protein
VTALAFSKKIALRYLWSKRSEAFITISSVISVLGVAIGVIVLTMTMAIMTGFETELRNKVVGSSHIFVHRVGGKLHNWKDTVKKIETLPAVQTVNAYTQHQVLLSAEGRSRGLLIRGIQEEGTAATELSRYLGDKKAVETLFTPVSTSVESLEKGVQSATLPGIIIGKELARTMLLYKGSKISLLSPDVGSTPFGLVPRFKRFVIVGIYSSGLTGYEEGLAYVNMKDAQQFFRLGDSISGIEVSLSDVDSAPQIAAKILDTLGGVGSGFYVQDWTQANKELWEAIQLEKQVYFIVLLLIIVMASFSIISMLIMVVLEKRRDIAILKTLGARTSTIGWIFRLQGAIIGVSGVVIGLIGGYLGCLALRHYGFPLPENVFPTSTVPVQIEAVNFIAVGISAFVICLLSTWYPVRRASAVEPSEVLRYE